MPLTCVPTSTLVTGSMVPVAVTVVEMLPFSTTVVSYSVLGFLEHEAVIAMAAMRAMLMMVCVLRDISVL